MAYARLQRLTICSGLRESLGLFVSLLLIEFTILLGGGILVLLVLGNEIVHVGLGLGELHLIHTLTSVPVQESLSPEHGGELFGNSLEELLDGGRVTNEGSAHLKSSWRDVADSGLDVVGDPLDKVRAVLVLSIEHLLIDFLHGHASSEHGGDGKVSAVSGVAGCHHVLGIEHLLGEFGHRERSVLLASSRSKWGETGHEKVQSREWYHVDGELSEIGVQLTRESKARGYTRHGSADQVVQVTVGWGGELEGSEANVVEGLVINAVGLIGVLDELMDGEGGVVWFYDGVTYLGRGYYGEGVHDSIGVLFSDLGDQ